MDQWEVHSRETLSILNTVEHFMLGSRAILKNVMDRLQRTDLSEQDVEELWDEVGQATDILDSTGKGIHDVTKQVVDKLGAEVLVRRDAWVGGMSGLLTEEEKLKFRSEPFWHTRELLSKERVEEACKVIERKAATKVQMACLQEKSKKKEQTSGVTKAKAGNDSGQNRKMNRKPYSRDEAGQKKDGGQRGGKKRSFRRRGYQNQNESQ